MKATFQLVENYLGQEVPSIVVFSGSSRYIFNVPGGYQRYSRTHQIKHVGNLFFFFTKKSSATIAGYGGLLLTLGTSNTAKIKSYVTPKMYEYYEDMKYQIGAKVQSNSYSDWSGRTQKALFYQSALSSGAKKAAQIIENLDHNKMPPSMLNDSSVFLKTEGPHVEDEECRIQPFFTQVNGEEITNYIFFKHASNPKILIEKVLQLNIPKKVLGQLTRFGRLTLDDGREVSIEQVTGPPERRADLVILHFSCVEAIRATLENSVFKNYLKDPQSSAHTVVHIAEIPEVVYSEEFRILLGLFSKDTSHLIYSRAFKDMEFSEEAWTSKLHKHLQIVSSIHKIYPHCLPNLIGIHQEYYQKCLAHFPLIENLFPEFNVKMAKRHYFGTLSFRENKSGSYVPSIDHVEESVELKKINIPELVKAGEPPGSINFAEYDPRVIFLGTGSMKPSTHRNVSCIFVEHTNKSSMMMDCGEGSYMQLEEHFGPNRIEEILLGLRIIFITHIHGDHSLGVLDIVSKRNKAMKRRNIQEKLFLVFPANVVSFFDRYSHRIENIYDGCEVVLVQSLTGDPIGSNTNMSKSMFVNCPTKEPAEKLESEEFYCHPEEMKILQTYTASQPQTIAHFREYLSSIGITQFRPIKVMHCPQSYGLIWQHKNGVKISYTGDSIPMKSFAQQAIDSTLLIHEATFSDDMQASAAERNHSTIGEAIDIGMISRSWKTALTHFSQRFKSGEAILEPKAYLASKQKCQYVLQNTIVCCDHLNWKLSESPSVVEPSRIISELYNKYEGGGGLED